MKITIDDLSAKEIADFLEERIKEMREISPPESNRCTSRAWTLMHRLAIPEIWMFENVTFGAQHG